MLLFLIRHAHADPGEPDEARPLSARGRDEARALADSLSRHRTPPAVVLTSPLIRAQETAEEIARATAAELRIELLLAPGATLERVRNAIGDEVRPVAAVCHQPDCSEIALALTGRDPGFAPAGLAELSLEA